MRVTRKAFMPNRGVPRAISPTFQHPSRSLSIASSAKKPKTFSPNSKDPSYLVGIAVGDLRRKFSVINIPNESLANINSVLAKIKTLADSKIMSNDDHVNFWSLWKEFCDVCHSISSDNKIKNQTISIAMKLHIAQKNIQKAKEQMQKTVPQINKQIREISLNIDELITALDNKKEFSDTYFQQFILDISTIKQKSPTSSFKKEMEDVYLATQSLRDLFKFKNASESLIEKYSIQFEQEIPHSKGDLIQKKDNMPNKQTLLQQQKDAKQKIIEDEESLEVQKSILDKKAVISENHRINAEIEKTQILVKRRKENLLEMKSTDLMGQMDNIGQAQPKKTTVKVPLVLPITPSSPKLEERIVELEEQKENYKLEIERQKTISELVMARELKEYLKEQSRIFRIENERAQEELDHVFAINESLNPDGDQMEVQIDNKRMIDEIEDTELQLSSSQKAFSSEMKVRGIDFSIDDLEDYQTNLYLYHQVVIEAAALRQISEIIKEENKNIHEKTKKYKSRKSNIEESQEWLLSVVDKYSQLERRYNELKSWASIPTLESIDAEMQKKNRNLESVIEKNGKAKVDEETKLAINLAKESSQKLLEEAIKLDQATTSAKEIMNQDLEEPTNRLEVAYHERMLKLREKEEIHNKLEVLCETLRIDCRDLSTEQLLKALSKK